MELDLNLLLSKPSGEGSLTEAIDKNIQELDRKLVNALVDGINKLPGESFYLWTIQRFDEGAYLVWKLNFDLGISENIPIPINTLSGWRRTCPAPAYDFSVYYYDHKHDKLSHLWTVPDKDTVEEYQKDAVACRQRLMRIHKQFDHSRIPVEILLRDLAAYCSGELDRKFYEQSTLDPRSTLEVDMRVYQ